MIADARRQAGRVPEDLAEQVGDFDDHAARAEDLNARLYREVIVSRMRPFADGVHGFPRLVRDMARSLGKEVAARRSTASRPRWTATSWRSSNRRCRT